MGIPGLFKILTKSEIFNGAIQNRLPNLPVDYFFIEGNALIYQEWEKLKLSEEFNQELLISSEEERELMIATQLAKAVFRATAALSKTVKPSRKVFLIFDGVAPVAKMMQQRGRRFKAGQARKEEPLFDTNAITPGTRFMDLLDKALTEILSEAEPNPDLPPVVYYSSSFNFGEGEHKMAALLRDMMNTKGKVIVIHGADADLLLIYSLFLANKNSLREVILFRENTENYKAKRVVSLSYFTKVLTNLYPQSSFPIHDFVFFMSLMGNDFLPRCCTFERVENGFDTLLYGYRHYLDKGGEPLTQTRFNQKNNKFKNPNLNWEAIFQFFLFIHENYNNVLLELWVRNVDGAAAKDLSFKEQCLIRQQVVSGRQQITQDVFQPDVFRKFWYQKVFKPIDYLRSPPEVTTPDIFNLVANYVEGLNWVYKYYVEGHTAVNSHWYYAYHYAPCFSDLVFYLKTELERYKKYDLYPWERKVNEHHYHLTAIDQLLIVLPLQSGKLLPPAFRAFHSPSSPLFDLFPSSFQTDYEGQTVYNKPRNPGQGSLNKNREQQVLGKNQEQVLGKNQEQVLDFYQAVPLIPFPYPRRVLYYTTKLPEYRYYALDFNEEDKNFVLDRQRLIKNLYKNVI